MAQLDMFAARPAAPAPIQLDMLPARATPTVGEVSAPARETPHQRRRRGAVNAPAVVDASPVVEAAKPAPGRPLKAIAKPAVELPEWAVFTGPRMLTTPPGQTPTILRAESAEEAVKVVSAWKAGKGGPWWAVAVVPGDDATPVAVELEAQPVEAASAEPRLAVFVAVPGDVQPPAEVLHAPAASTACSIVATRLEIAEDRCLALPANGFEEAPVAGPMPDVAPAVDAAPVVAAAAPRPGSKAAQRAAAEAAAEDEHRSPLEILGELARLEHEIDDAIGGLVATLTPEGTALPAAPLLTACVVDGVAMLTCEAGTVAVADVLARLLLTDGVGHALLADVAREIAMGEPMPDQGLGGDIGASMVSLFTRSSRRAELEIQVLERQHAAILGCSLDELPARLAADKAKEAAWLAAEKVARQSRGAVAVEPAPGVEPDDAAPTKPVRAPAPKRAARGSKASPIVTAPPAAGPADVAAQSMRRLKPRQVELLAKVRVEHGRAIYGSGYEDTIPDWKNVKETMLALGGAWAKENKGKGIPPGFTFPEGVDVEETIRLAQTTGEVLDPKLAGFFATPVEHAKSLAARLGLQPGWRVLEPSAGTGRLAVAARDLGAIVYAVEPLPKNRAALVELGFALIGEDIVALDPESIDLPSFDAVIANVPFDREIAHIMHVGRFLDAGGPVASIASAGVEFRMTKDAVAFRAFLAVHGGTIETMPEGSFLESGTGVRTVIVEYKACAGCRAGTCEGRR